MALNRWKDYQDLFRDLKPRIWLNHAGVSPISSRVAGKMEEHIRDVSRYGSAHVAQWYGNLKRVKTLAAGFLGCDPSDLSITPNTTHGINLVANGLQWNEGDEIVLCTKEYPANVYPWWAQESRGVRLVWVEPDADGRFPVESYASKINSRTRVVTVSHVQFASGYRHDLARLGEICRKAGVFFFVDAIQSFSVFEIHVREWGIDALTTGSHKWLLGPTGVALFYTSPEAKERIQNTYVGADSMVDGLNYLDYRFDPYPDGRRYENAMLNFAGVAGLEAALETVYEFGMGRIREKILEISSLLLERFLEMGFRNHSSRREDEWSGILSLSHPDVGPEVLQRELAAESIYTSVRDHRLRVSPHAYHSDEDLDRICSTMEHVLRRTR